MRILVMFDLPTTEKEDIKIYTKFRNSLLKEGFDMLQYSVYCRVCANKFVVDKYIAILERISPSRGSIRVMYLTEKQYSNMMIITGGKTDNEIIIKDRRFIYFI